MLLNKKKVLFVAIAMSFATHSVSANDVMMTVGEYEVQAEQIYKSNLEFSEKAKQLKNLESLWDAQQSLLNKILKSKIKEQTSINPVSAAPVERVKEKEEAVVIAKNNDYIRENIGWNVSSIFLSDLVIIGSDATARVLINGENKTIDLNREIKLKRVYAGNIITGFEADGIYIKDVKTNKTKLIYTTSENSILEKIKFNNELAQEYAKNKALGELDIHLNIKNSQAKSSSTPLPATYPVVLDSMSVK